MANPEALVRGAAIVVGLLFGALGLFVTLMALGVFGGGWTSGATPTWVGLAVGLVFTLGGLAVIVDYGIAAAPRSTPRTSRWVCARSSIFSGSESRSPWRCS